MLDSGVQFTENTDAAREGGTVARTTVPSSTEVKPVNLPDDQSTKAVSVRMRFEVFKRDDFTCRYCGRKSPDVVLEVDHVVPVCEGGTNDSMNLVTSCWDCNRGKAGVPLTRILTGEDPHDKAIELLERERQLQEYNRVLDRERQYREARAWELVRYWLDEQGLLTEKQRACEEALTIGRQDFGWLKSALKWCPDQQIKEFMDVAIARRLTKNMRYVAGCCRNWRYERLAERPPDSDDGAY